MSISMKVKMTLSKVFKISMNLQFAERNISLLELIDIEDGSSEEELKLKVKTLLKIRHDFLEVFVCEHLGIEVNPGRDKQVREYDFMRGIALEQFELNLSPDIVFQDSGGIVILDPTFSHSISESRARKDKYFQLVHKLNELGVKSRCIVVHSYKNEDLRTVLARASIDSMPDHCSVYSEILSIVEDKLSFLSAKQLEQLPIETTLYTRPMSFLKTDKLKQTKELLLHEKTLGGGPNISEEDFKQAFKELAEDPLLDQLLRDKRTCHNEIAKCFNAITVEDCMVKDRFKPTFHILHCDHCEIPIQVKDNGMPIDQKNSYAFLKWISQLRSNQKIPKTEKVYFLTSLFSDLETALASPGDSELFKSNTYTGTEQGDHDKLCDALTLSRKILPEDLRQKLKGQSIRGLMKGENVGLRSLRPFIGKYRCLDSGNWANKDSFSIKAGDNFLKTHPDGRKYEANKSCPLSGAHDFEMFLDFVTLPSQNKNLTDPLYDIPPGVDSCENLKLKEEARCMFRNYLKLVSQTRCYGMFYHTQLVCKQLIHYMGLNTKPNTFYFLNSGLPNVMHIMRGGVSGRSGDSGRAFCSVAFTKDDRWCSNVFGSFEKHHVSGGFLIITGWRRLDCTKLMAISDNFTSTLMTGFDTYSRGAPPLDNKFSIISYLRFTYTFRALVGMNTSQKCAELLMDVRYLIMSFCSTHTDVASLIKDKFGPSYPNCMSRWIVSQLQKKSGTVAALFNDPSSFRKNIAKFSVSGKRDIRTTGGNINLPSIWGDHVLLDLQDLFDELFVYVHTMKEPASEYYESIKSLKTILEYQTQYDNLHDHEKAGDFTAEGFKEFLLDKTKGKVGCWAQAIYWSSKRLSRTLDKNRLKQSIRKSVMNEPLSEVESTKSVIPEYKRDGEPIKENSKEKKYITRQDHLKNWLDDSNIHIDSEFIYQRRKLTGVVDGSPIIEDNLIGRTKVHDAILDHLIRQPTHSNVMDVSMWNINENCSRVDAHYCIKAQYGPKREFYVVNFGAKCMVRSYESIYKSIAIQLPEEMISVPGDKKLIYMEDLSNESAKSNKPGNVYYCNGDCTKWSACETMSSFMAMSAGLKDCIGEEVHNFNLSVLSAWADKRIYIPDIVLENIKFVTKKSEYLKDGEYRHSSQNFMQGMFNYSSSVKAVAATRLAFDMFNEVYPNKLELKHLEHSDDYVLLMRCSDIETVEKFRVYHKLSQRMHGINDSSKKTNIQMYIMEFISLMSFNGRMAYPNIKKTKEVGLNVGAEGYQRDIMNAISRSSESVRLGVPLFSCYIQQLIQSVNLYRAYSLDKRNKTDSSKHPFNFPVELYGMPDTLPIAYINTKSDVNNYRLYLYGSDYVQELIKGLFILGEEDDSSVYDGFKYQPLYSPSYTLPKQGKKIKRIRTKVGVTYEQSVKFKQEYPEYQVMKPNEPKLFKMWLKAMYWNKSFCRAYTRISRPNLLLHISYMVSGHSIKYYEKSIEKTRRMTMLEFSKKLFFDCKTAASRFRGREQELLFTLTGLSASPQIFFNLTENMALINRNGETLNTISINLPKTSMDTIIRNSAESIIQYMISPERCSIDNRMPKFVNYVQSDIDAVKEFNWKGEFSKTMSVYKVLTLGKNRHTVGMGCSERSNSSFENYLTSYLENNTFLGKKRKLLMQVGKNRIVNFRLGTEMYTMQYGKEKRHFSIVLDNVSQLIYYYMLRERKFSWELEEILGNWSVKGVPVLDYINKTLKTEADLGIYESRVIGFIELLKNDKSQIMDRLVKSSLVFKKKKVPNLHPFCDKGGYLVQYEGRVSATFIENDIVYLICNKMSFTKMNKLYCICLVIFGKLSIGQLERRMSGKMSVQMSNVKMRPQISGTIDYNLRLEQGFLESSYGNDNCLPIYITRRHLYFRAGEEIRLGASYRLSDTSPQVFHGGLPIFTLPLFTTNDTFLLRARSGKEFDTLKANILSENGLLSCYLLGKDFDLDLSSELSDKLFPDPTLKLTEIMSMPKPADIQSKYFNNLVSINSQSYKLPAGSTDTDNNLSFSNITRDVVKEKPMIKESGHDETTDIETMRDVIGIPKDESYTIEGDIVMSAKMLAGLGQSTPKVVRDNEKTDVEIEKSVNPTEKIEWEDLWLKYKGDVEALSSNMLKDRLVRQMQTKQGVLEELDRLNDQSNGKIDSFRQCRNKLYSSLRVKMYEGLNPRENNIDVEGKAKKFFGKYFNDVFEGRIDTWNFAIKYYEDILGFEFCEDDVEDFHEDLKELEKQASEQFQAVKTSQTNKPLIQSENEPSSSDKRPATDQAKMLRAFFGKYFEDVSHKGMTCREFAVKSFGDALGFELDEDDIIDFQDDLKEIETEAMEKLKSCTATNPLGKMEINVKADVIKHGEFPIIDLMQEYNNSRDTKIATKVLKLLEQGKPKDTRQYLDKVYSATMRCWKESPEGLQVTHRKVCNNFYMAIKCEIQSPKLSIQAQDCYLSLKKKIADELGLTPSGDTISDIIQMSRTIYIKQTSCFLIEEGFSDGEAEEICGEDFEDVLERIKQTKEYIDCFNIELEKSDDSVVRMSRAMEEFLDNDDPNWDEDYFAEMTSSSSDEEVFNINEESSTERTFTIARILNAGSIEEFALDAWMGRQIKLIDIHHIEIFQLIRLQAILESVPSPNHHVSATMKVLNRIARKLIKSPGKNVKELIPVGTINGMEHGYFRTVEGGIIEMGKYIIPKHRLGDRCIGGHSVITKQCNPIDALFCDISALNIEINGSFWKDLEYYNNTFIAQNEKDQESTGIAQWLNDNA